MTEKTCPQQVRVHVADRGTLNSFRSFPVNTTFVVQVYLPARNSHSRNSVLDLSKLAACQTVVVVLENVYEES